MSELNYKPKTLHWAEELEVGDKVYATIRHKTDGEKNLHNIESIVIGNDNEKSEIHIWFVPGHKAIVPYNDLTSFTVGNGD